MDIPTVVIGFARTLALWALVSGCVAVPAQAQPATARPVAATAAPVFSPVEPMDSDAPPMRYILEFNALGCLQAQGGVEARARDFFELAAADLPSARFNLGVMLVRGQGGDVELARGQAQIESAWKDGRLPEAGAWLLDSALDLRDLRAAGDFANELRVLAHPRVDLAVARLRFAEGRHAQAMKHLLRAADAGNVMAQRLQAMLNQHGTGLPRDAMESASWQMIAEAMLSPARPRDSVFHAAVKHSLQANDWTPRGPVPAEIGLACSIPQARS